MIWAKEETLPRAEIEKIQLERLKETVHYIYEKVVYLSIKYQKAKAGTLTLPLYIYHNSKYIKPREKSLSYLFE